MRLIDADWVLENIKPYELSDEDWSVTGGTAIRLICTAVNQAPTIDAVPVVRCRDCKYRFQNNGHSRDGCPIIDSNIWMGDDSFCSYGERKEGANNG